MDAIAKGFAAYLVDKVAGARNVTVNNVGRIHGGASRETYRLAVAYEADGHRVEQGMILRRDPKAVRSSSSSFSTPSMPCRAP